MRFVFSCITSSQLFFQLFFHVLFHSLLASIHSIFFLVLLLSVSPSFHSLLFLPLFFHSISSRSVILPSLIPSFHYAFPPTFLLSIHYFVLPHIICHGFPFFLPCFFIPSVLPSLLPFFVIFPSFPTQFLSSCLFIWK